MRKFIRRLKNKTYRIFLHIYYRPKAQWEKEYVKDLYIFASFKPNWTAHKKLFLERLNERQDLLKHFWSKKLNLFKFYLDFKFIGAEYEDYFSYRFYSISCVNKKKFITRQKINFFKRYLNTENNHYVVNKSEFAEYWKEFFNRPFVNSNNCSKEEFIKLFSDCKKLIVKPEDLNCGIGIFVLDNNPSLIENNYQTIKNSNKNLIVEEYIEQNGFLHTINPSSLNTLRIITIRKNNNVKVVAGFLRAGGKDSIIDNFHSGGVMYPINVGNGIIAKGLAMNTNERFSKHPYTGVQVAGKGVPKFDEAKDICIRAHKKAPKGLDFLGWDVCVSDDKILLIEGNDGPLFPMIINRKDNIWKRIRSILNN